jgi:hypothetical protein
VRQSRSDGSGTVYYLSDEAPPARGGRVWHESDDGATTRRSYTYAGADETVPLSWSEGGQSFFVLDDGAGTVRLIGDAAGRPVAAYAFTAFGAAQPGSGGPGGRLVYQRGRRLDLERDLLIGFDGLAADPVRGVP